MEQLIHLTKSEEQIMLKLWCLEQGSVKEILAQFTTPKPAYNTVSTIVRILEKKNFIGHQKKGRGYVYFPLVSKNEYAQFLTEHLLNNYYKGSQSSLISSLNKTKRLDDLL